MADETKIDINLSREEEKEMQDGQALYEMTQTSGFKVLQEKLDDLAYHSWVDPREAPSKEEWEWRELNGFHAANTARELLEWVSKAISNSEYLEKKKKGEIKNAGGMKIQ